MNKIGRHRLETIAESLTSAVEKLSDPGWMTGLTGIAVFFFHYARSKGSGRLENLAYLALEKALRTIESGFARPSFAAGITGMRWALHHLGDQGFIKPAEAKVLDDLNPMLYSFAEEQMKLGEYDVLHGALGYIAGQHKPDTSKTRQTGVNNHTLIEELLKHKTTLSPNHIAWETQNPKSGTPEINLGTAHGLPSILLQLSRVGGVPGGPHFRGDDKLILDIIEQGVDYLLSTRLKGSANGSVFAHRLVDGETDQPGRLAWCYGDPGVAAALWQIGFNCGRLDWQQTAIEILRIAGKRVRTRENRLYDACVCHGTAGLALIYFKMAELTQYEPFLDTAAHWLRATIDHGHHDSDSAGYKFLGPGNRYVPNYSFLEGIAGVGLTICTLLDGESSGWEAGLML